MTKSNEVTPYPIVVGVDYSELGDLALERACNYARAHEHAHLHVVHVEATAASHPHAKQDETAKRDLGEASKRLLDHVEQIVKRWCDAHASPVPFYRLTTHLRSERAAEAIAQLASDVEAELVVVGTHGWRGAHRFLLGSTAETIVRLAPCAVLVVRPRDAKIPQIEPPCPQCLETRRETGGKQLWCAQHSRHREKEHTYHYAGAPGWQQTAHQSGLLIHVD